MLQCTKKLTKHAEAPISCSMLHCSNLFGRGFEMPITAPARPNLKPQTGDGAEVIETQIKTRAKAKKTAKAKKPATAKAKIEPQVKADATGGAEAVIKIGSKMTKNTFKESTESLQQGFEKITQDCEKMVSFQKEATEALVESATVAGKGIETINKAVLEYSQASVEDMAVATKAIMASKSLQEAVEKQTAFMKSAFETYVAEMTKVGDLALGTAKAASEPVQKQVDVAASLVKSAAS